MSLRCPCTERAKKLEEAWSTISRRGWGKSRKKGSPVMLRYHVKLSKDTNNTILVEVPDVPGALTFGEDREEALLRAPDAIETVLIGYIADRREIPMPRAYTKGPFATLPALTEAKLALYTAMRTARISKAELARRLSCH